MTPTFTPKYALPTEDQIRETIDHLQRRLRNDQAKKPKNQAVKLGYELAVTILAEGRKTYEGIDVLKYTQSRAIAVLAVDYLNGDETQEVLINVPFK